MTTDIQYTCMTCQKVRVSSPFFVNFLSGNCEECDYKINPCFECGKERDQFGKEGLCSTCVTAYTCAKCGELVSNLTRECEIC